MSHYLCGRTPASQRVPVLGIEFSGRVRSDYDRIGPFDLLALSKFPWGFPEVRCHLSLHDRFKVYSLGFDGF